MILLHRLTPFALAAIVMAGFWCLVRQPAALTVSAVLLFVVMPLLLARLLLWEYRRPAFWVFLTVPVFLVASSFLFAMFLEAAQAKLLLGVMVALAVTLYTENLFAFYHLPSTYQAYSLEYLTLVMAVLGAFFYASGANAANAFLSYYVPLWIPCVVTFFVVLVLTLATFWVSKVGFETGRRYAVAGAFLFTEVYLVLALLPTSFVTNAAAFTTLLYCYLGLMRAHVLEKLSSKVVRRYAVTGVLLLAVIFGTAQWL